MGRCLPGWHFQVAKAFGLCMLPLLGWVLCQAVCELAHEMDLRNTSKLPMQSPG